MLRKAVFPRSHLADYSDDLSIFTNTRVSARPKVSAIFWPKPKPRPILDFLAETSRNRTFGRTLIYMLQLAVTGVPSGWLWRATSRDAINDLLGLKNELSQKYSGFKLYIKCFCEL